MEGIVSGLCNGQKRGCDLAFFSVVASSPNLSTFITQQKYGNYFNLQNKFFCKKVEKRVHSSLLCQILYPNQNKMSCAFPPIDGQLV